MHAQEKAATVGRDIAKRLKVTGGLHKHPHDTPMAPPRHPCDTPMAPHGDLSCWQGVLRQQLFEVAIQAECGGKVQG